MVFSSTHGLEARWQLETVRRLQAAEPGNGTGFIPSPNMLDFSERIAGCTIFSKVDLRRATIRY
jgi:hypothetical protein